jgi:hypothetical protein
VMFLSGYQRSSHTHITVDIEITFSLEYNAD